MSKGTGFFVDFFLDLTYNSQIYKCLLIIQFNRLVIPTANTMHTTCAFNVIVQHQNHANIGKLTLDRMPDATNSGIVIN